MRTLSIIIPVYNEQQFVVQLLEKLAEVDFGNERNTQRVIVNDGSTDSSAERIEAFIREHSAQDITFISQPNGGKGKALKTGIAQATGEVLIVQDADLEYDPNDIAILLKRLTEKNYDVLYGSRIRGFFKYGIHYSTLFFLFGGLTVSVCASVLSGKFITDEPTCYKMFTKKCIPILLSPAENGFEREPAVTMALLRSGYRYAERPIHYFPRKVAAGKKIKLKDGFKALQTLRTRRRKKLNS